MPLNALKTLKSIVGTSPTADNSNLNARGGPYGEQFVIETLDDGDGQAVSGIRYQVLPTPAAGGTGNGIGIQTTFSDTANVAFVLVNGASAGGKRVIMEYIKFRVTVAGQSTTSCEAAIEIDDTNRYSSGGTSLVASIVSCTTEDNTASVVTPLRVAAVTAGAAGAHRKWLWHNIIRKAAAPMWIVNDTVTFAFGNFEGLPIAATQIDTTNANGSEFTWRVPPAVIGPGGSLLLHLANVANASTAPSLAFEAGWKEF